MSLKSRLLFYFQRSSVTENSQLNILKTLIPPTHHKVEKLKQELKNKIKRAHYFYYLLLILEIITGWWCWQNKFDIIIYLGISLFFVIIFTGCWGYISLFKKRHGFFEIKNSDLWILAGLCVAPESKQ